MLTNKLQAHQLRRTHPRGSKMGKSAHVRTPVEPHSNLKLVSLYPRGSKTGKSAHERTSVEPHSNLKLVSLFCKARTILATLERVRKQVRNFIYPLEDLKRCMFVSFMKNFKLYYYTDSRKFVKNCCRKRPT